LQLRLTLQSQMKQNRYRKGSDRFMLMYDGAISGRQAELTRLRNAIETELSRGPFCVGVKAPLRDGYREATAVPRSRELTLVCHCGSALYLLAVLTTYLLSASSPAWFGLAAQCVLAPCLAFCIAHTCFRPENTVLLRESGALAAAACFGLATLLAVFTNNGSPTALNFLLVSLAVISALVFVHLRFTAAVALVVLTALILWLVLPDHGDVPDDMRGTPLGFLLAISAPALFSVHQLERASRQVYLKALLQDVTIEQLAYENSMLSQLSITDALTGAANRRQLEAALRKLCADPPCGDFLLLADIDFFKGFNDRHGHLAGDACLREVVAAMRCQLRRSDLIARFGGEEFAVVLPCTTRADALMTAERIRAAVASQTIMVNGCCESVTVSIGIAERHGAMTPASLMTLADDALYAAKREGRNLVRTAAQAVRDVAA
jgi:diguanylate cyclase (GGDEF)-like protein